MHRGFGTRVTEETAVQSEKTSMALGHPTLAVHGSLWRGELAHPLSAVGSGSGLPACLGSREGFWNILS